MRKILIMLCAALTGILAVSSAFADDLALISLPGVLRPGKYYDIVVNIPYSGTISLFLLDQSGNVSCDIFTNYPVSAGENIISWDGIKRDQSVLSIALKSLSDDPVTIINETNMEAGSNTFQWDGKVNGTSVPEGQYALITGTLKQDGMYCAMAIRINGGILIHEVPHLLNADGTKNYASFEAYLGIRKSHGCIRVQRKKTPEGYNQQWIWENFEHFAPYKVIIWDDAARVDTPVTWQGNLR